MRRKKFFVLALIAILLVGVVACAPKDEAKKTDSEKKTVEEKVEEKADKKAEEKAEEKTDEKTEKTVLVVGTSASYKPWAFQEKDKVQGYEIDVWEEIAKRNNYELEIKLGKFSGLVGMLDAGEIDTVAHQMSITPERLEKYNFTTPYAYSYYDFFTKADAEFKTIDDLKGKKVGCWLGGNGEATLRDINEKHNLELDIVTFDGAPMEQEVLLGRIDAFWQGEIKTKTIINEEGLDIKQLNEKLVYETNAYPFRMDEEGEKFAKEVGETIDAMRADGTLKALSEKWFGLDTTEVEE